MDGDLRLLVVDDHTLLRQVLQAALAGHDRLRVVGEAATGGSALAEARRLRPDVVVLDGDPLEGYWNWLKTKVVVKGGMVVVDKR